MNTLNSLIIEGNVVNGEWEKDVFKFTLGSTRFYKDSNGNEDSETSFFEVRCYGKLAERFQNGTKLRIVGRLKSEGKKVFIVAEYIEIKKIKN